MSEIRAKGAEIYLRQLHFRKKMAKCSFQPTAFERAGIRTFYLASELYYRQAINL